MTRHILLPLMLVLPILGCNGRKGITVYSPDNTQLLRFERVEGNVFLFEGKDAEEPSVILDYENVDLAGQVYLKWIMEDGQYSWYCCFHNGQIIKKDIVCTNCRVITEFPLDSIGGPCLKGYTPPNFVLLHVNPFRVIGVTDLHIE